MAAFRKFEYNLNEETQFLYLTLCLFLLYYLSVVGLPVCTLHTLSPSLNKMAKQQRHVQSVWHKFWHHATHSTAQLHKCHTEYNRDPRSALRLMLMLLLVMLPHLAGF